MWSRDSGLRGFQFRGVGFSLGFQGLWAEDPTVLLEYGEGGIVIYPTGPNSLRSKPWAPSMGP